MKVTIIGAGNVGATTAMRIAESGLADVVLLDIAKEFCLGKVLDLIDAAPIVGHTSKITQAKDYEDIKDSKVVVITAGLARAPGMTREELFMNNSSILKNTVENIKLICPKTIIIVVTNPLDAMTLLAYKQSGFQRSRVIGMAGALDTSRFKALLAEELKVQHKDIETYVIGTHGDTMVPLISHTKIKGRPITKVMDKGKIEEVVERTKIRGAEIVNLLKNSSAYYAPSASVFSMTQAVLKDTNEVICASCFLDGEYGVKGISIGVPAQIGKSGIKKIIELKLSDEERGGFKKAVESVRSAIGGKI